MRIIDSRDRSYTFGIFAGVFLTPDLDLAENMLRHYDPVETIQRLLRAHHLWGAFGVLVAATWWMYWLLYGKLFSHRSWLSHVPIIATVVRLVYAFWWVPLILASIGFPTPSAQMEALFLYAFGGLCLSDTLHFLMDAIT